MAESATQKESLVVRLDSEPSEVNANAVASSMSAVIALIFEAQQGIAENQQLLIKARPFAEGSFEIPLELIAVTTAALFADSPLIQHVLDILTKYFDVKAALKGQPPPKNESDLVNINGQAVAIGSIVLNMIQPSSIANREVDRAMRHMEMDTTIEGFEVLRGPTREIIVRVPRADLSSFQIAEPKQPMVGERDVESREKLYIVAPIFQGKASWKFNRAGHIIPAHITDESFVERVTQGTEVFAAGDQLDVDLVVHQELDESTTSYINKKYTIQHVWGHEKRQVQQTFPEESQP